MWVGSPTPYSTTERNIVDRVPEDFVIARNAEPGSTLPYLLRVPLGDGIILKAKDTWPRTGKVYCHRVEEWPADVEILERVPVRACVRRGAAIDLVLDRGRENRSQIIITNARGRQMIFWQTARTSKQARPAVTLRGARASGVADLQIAVDIHERYPFTFAGRPTTTRRAPLRAGDYGHRRRTVAGDRGAQVPDRPRLLVDHGQAEVPAH